MTKKDFIALADAIREHNRVMGNRIGFGDTQAKPFDAEHLDTLASVCGRGNPAFDRTKWIGYVRGENGPNGGTR